MKRLITICLVLLLCASAFAVPRSSGRDERGAYTGPRVGTEPDDNIKAAIDILYDITREVGTGSVFYVDSGETTGTENGISWTTAYDTLDEAISACTAGNGDKIYVAAGHAETFTIASSTEGDFDVMGISVEGKGNGKNRPTFVFSVVDAYFLVSASNTHISGLRLLTGLSTVKNLSFTSISTDDCLMRITAPDVTIESCDFISTASPTHTFITAIEGTDNLKVLNCYNDSETLTTMSTTAFIYASPTGSNVAGRSPSGWVITGNTSTGAYHKGNIAICASEHYHINSIMSLTNAVISNNILVNSNTSAGAVNILVGSGTTGVCSYNSMYSNEEGTDSSPFVMTFLDQKLDTQRLGQMMLLENYGQNAAQSSITAWLIASKT